MSKARPPGIDQAFADALDRFDVPSHADGFLEMIAHAPSRSQSRTGTSAIWPRLHGRNTWRRGTLVGIVALGLASAAAAATGMFGPIHLDVPPIAKLFAPSPNPIRVRVPHAKPRSVEPRPLPERPSPAASAAVSPAAAMAALPNAEAYVQPPMLPRVTPLLNDRRAIGGSLPHGRKRPATAPVLQTLREIVRRQRVEMRDLALPERQRGTLLPVIAHPLARENVGTLGNRRAVEPRPRLDLPAQPEAPRAALPQPPAPPGVPDARPQRPDTLKELRQSRDLHDLRDLRSKRQALRRLRRH